MFLTLGFKSVTMDDIAREMGISKKTIYSHFENKLKLVRETTFYVFEKINTGICSICAERHNPIAEIYSIKSLVSEHLKGDKSSPQYQLQKYYPQVFDDLKEKQIASISECVKENLERGIEEGFYRKEIDVELVTKFYLSGNMGLTNLKLFPIEQYNQMQTKSAFLEYHLRAISTEKGLETLLNLIEK